MQADNFQLKSTSQMGPMSSMSNSIASVLCVDKVTSLWPLLFFTVITVESNSLLLPSFFQVLFEVGPSEGEGKKTILQGHIDNIFM